MVAQCAPHDRPMLGVDNIIYVWAISDPGAPRAFSEKG